jgi:hypothetical protein
LGIEFQLRFGFGLGLLFDFRDFILQLLVLLLIGCHSLLVVLRVGLLVFEGLLVGLHLFDELLFLFLDDTDLFLNFSNLLFLLIEFISDLFVHQRGFEFPELLLKVLHAFVFYLQLFPCLPYLLLHLRIGWLLLLLGYLLGDNQIVDPQL